MKPLLLLAFCLATFPARAAPVLATPFRDGAVLQRGKPVPVWGKADPGETLKVEFKGQAHETMADAQGLWSTSLDPLEASDAPARLVVSGKQIVTIEDVLVGEVWLCSGQSNMNLSVRQVDHAAQEIAEGKHPLIRQFLVEGVVSEQPQTFVEGNWQACSPETVGDFTAVGYFFARELHRELKVPVGIIHATLGGSPVEGWISQPVLAGNPAFGVVAERWQVMKPKVSGKGLRNMPSGLYNGLIHPLEPFALAGFAWYQGEGNRERPTEYAALFTTMIKQWRSSFQQGDLPFLFVQLPNFAEPADKKRESWPLIREAQASALAMPNTGMAVTLDVGDPAQLHPGNKQAVGRRLGAVALAQVYGRKVEHSGPAFAEATPEGAAMRVRFNNAAGLAFKGDPREAFELAGADGKYLPGEARIEGETVVVSAPGLDKPVSVRFEWKNAPTAWLFNAAGLPAAPFRTDHH